MTLVACILVALALLDGACSGFRSSLGRTGLVRHRRADREAATQGLIVVVALLMPTAASVIAGVGLGHVPTSAYRAAGEGMLVILVPYAALAAVALAAYAVLGWRQKYVAMALILGPITLVRPVIAVSSAVAGWLACHSWMPSVAVALSVVAVLAVEPLMNLRWRR